MRAPSWLLGNVRMPPPEPNPPYDPRLAARLAAAQRAARRRLSVRIEDVFHDACLGGDFGAAEALFVACAAATRNGARAAGTDRRATGPDRRATGPDLGGLRELLDYRRLVADARAGGHRRG